MFWRPIGLAAGVVAMSTAAAPTDISPATWPEREYERILAAQAVDHPQAGVAAGTNGAVTVAYNGVAARRPRGAQAAGAQSIRLDRRASVRSRAKRPSVVKGPSHPEEPSDST